MRILGIDPGLQVCGYACLEVGMGRENLIEAGFIRTNQQLPLAEKLNRIAQDMDVVLDTVHPEIVAVEQLYAHYAHPRTSILMGHARGVLLLTCRQAGVDVRNVAATKVKKSITGNGHASKLQIQRAIQALFSLPELPSPPDVADALAIAMCAGSHIG